MSDQQGNFSGYARVEIMGHGTHLGHVTTEVYGGASLFRVDQPEIPEYEETVESSEWIEGRAERIPAGSVVKRPAIPGVSVLLGVASIYRIIPCTEEACIKAIKYAMKRAPLMLVKLPAVAQIPAPQSASFPPDDEEEEEEDDPPIVNMSPRQFYDSYRDNFPNLCLGPFETLTAEEQNSWLCFLSDLKVA